LPFGWLPLGLSTAEVFSTPDHQSTFQSTLYYKIAAIVLNNSGKKNNVLLECAPWEPEDLEKTGKLAKAKA
jgi:hypothetical protein